jgi:MFS family permease
MELKKVFKNFQTAHAKSYSLTPKTPTKFQITILGMLLVTTLTLSLINFNKFQVGTYIDDADYVILAESFVSSPYYGYFNEPIQDKQSQFPFGFPLLLSVGAFLFPGNLEVMKVFSLIATLINISILFWGWRLLSHMDSYWMGLIVAGLYAVFPLVIQQSTMIMSEAIFFTFYLLALILTEQAARKEEKSWWAIAMITVIFFLGFTRTIGVVFIFSLIVYLLFIRGLSFWRQLITLITGVVILTSLIIWLTPVTTADLLPTEYFRRRDASLLTKLSTIFSPVSRANDVSINNSENNPQPADNNTVQQTGQNENEAVTPNLKAFFLGINYHIAQDIRQIILPIGMGKGKKLTNFLTTQDFLMYFGYLISGLVFFGIARLFALKKLSIFVLSAFPYLAAIMLWVWHGPRLLYPIFPQMQFCFFMGLGWVTSILVSTFRFKFLNNISTLILVIVSILIGSVSIYKSLRIDDSRIHAGDVQARTDWLRANVGNTANIMTEYPEVDYIYSGRRTIRYPYLYQVPSSDALETYLTRNQVNYILVAPKIDWLPAYSPSLSDWTNHLLPYVKDLANKKKLDLVFVSSDNLIRVYKRPN